VEAELVFVSDELFDERTILGLREAMGPHLAAGAIQVFGIEFDDVVTSMTVNTPDAGTVSVKLRAASRPVPRSPNRA
jgi:hypothetical protein